MYKLSTKQKREVYAISNLLLHMLAFAILLLSLNSCTEKDLTAAACATPATIKDMRGLDGCGYVFVLDNGQKLEPVSIASPNNTSPQANELTYQLQNFSFKDGQRVKIAYKEINAVSICMVGQTVEITCISEVETTGTSNL